MLFLMQRVGVYLLNAFIKVNKNISGKKIENLDISIDSSNNNKYVCIGKG